MPAPDLVLTTSWDDGYPADIRLGEVLQKYGVNGTFYIPRRNCEGRSVMASRDIYELAQSFEIGCHTVDHVVLTTLDRGSAEHQIRDSKAWMEDIIGRPAAGFCYPRGKFDATTKAMTEGAGFSYARTVKNFCLNAGADQFEMPTTIQFFPHPRTAYLKNLIGGGIDSTRLRLFLKAAATGSLLPRIKHLVDSWALSGGVFHLWGHSWEIEERSLWAELELTLKYISESCRTARFVENGSVFAAGFVQ